MSARPKRWQIVVLLLAAVVGVALAGAAARRGARDRCALDGAHVDPRYRVRVVDAAGRSWDFCSVRCAGLWLDHQDERPRAVYVTDEASGQEVEAGEAFFVRSRVVTAPAARNRIHAFRSRADAERHAAAAGGRLLTGAGRPFVEQ